MKYQQATFKASYGLSSQLPEHDRPEIVFSGRSNVGKSSLINKLCNRKNLARVSATPGKTATINFYNLDDQLHIVDLPGYGYAKVGLSDKQRWAGLIEGYLKDERRNLGLVVQLVDIRRPPSDQDLQMLTFLQQMEIPYVVVLTKADKLNQAQRRERLASIAAELPGDPEGTVIIPFSALSGEGVDELREILGQLVQFAAEHPEMLTNEEPEADGEAESEDVKVEYIGFDAE